MVVKVRLNYGRKIRKAAGANRHAVALTASLMMPISVAAWALAAWRVLADLKLAGGFAISTGLFSHWQVWVALALAVQFGAFLLHRASRGEGES